MFKLNIFVYCNCTVNTVVQPALRGRNATCIDLSQNKNFLKSFHTFLNSYYPVKIDTFEISVP